MISLNATVDSLSTLPEVTGVAQESLNVLDLAVKGGWIMIVLLILSIIGIYIFFERYSVLHKARHKNPSLLARLHDNLKDRDFKSAIIYCNRQNTPISRILAKGVKDYNFDNASIRQALENNAGLEIAALEKGLPVLSTIAAVAPMLGFLGTVTGMVRAFWNMAQAGDNIEVSALSGGIYEAMVTTVGGLVVGIIAIFAYNYLVSKVDKVQNAMEADIISFLEIVAETKGNTVVAAKAPVQPVAAAPVQPVVVAPVQPVAAAPVQPVAAAPVQPVAAAPVQPVAAAPVQPVAAAPVQPVAAAPVQPVAAAPVQPVAAAPVQPVAAAPVQPVAAAPVQPVAAAPVQPVAAAPVQPVAAAPVQPVAAAPAQPVAAAQPADEASLFFNAPEN